DLLVKVTLAGGDAATVRCLRKRRARFAAVFLRDRERAIKPRPRAICLRMTHFRKPGPTHRVEARGHAFRDHASRRRIKQNMSLNEVQPQIAWNKVSSSWSIEAQRPSPTVRRTSAGVAPEARKSRRLVASVDFANLRPAASTISLW